MFIVHGMKQIKKMKKKNRDFLSKITYFGCELDNLIRDANAKNHEIYECVMEEEKRLRQE